MASSSSVVIRAGILSNKNTNSIPFPASGALALEQAACEYLPNQISEFGSQSLIKKIFPLVLLISIGVDVPPSSSGGGCYMQGILKGLRRSVLHTNGGMPQGSQC